MNSSLSPPCSVQEVAHMNTNSKQGDVNMRKLLISMVAVMLSLSCLAGAAETKAEGEGRKLGSKYEVKAAGIAVKLDEAGNLLGCLIGEKRSERALAGQTMLDGFKNVGKVEAKKSSHGVCEFTRRMTDSKGHFCLVTDRFSPTKDSIRWEVDIVGEGAPWSVPIKTSFQTAPDSNTRFWAPWSDPRVSPIGAINKDEAQIANGIVPPNAGGNWADPLVSRPLSNCTLWFGAPYFRYDNPRIGFCPFQGDLLCIPMVSLLWGSDDTGVSLVLDPQDSILDLTLDATAAGNLSFSRLFLRISDKSPIHFAADLVAHEADWRGGLRWMVRRYPEYFDPINPAADDLAGTGAYSSLETEFDVAKMKKMAFRTNWKASFDFPYMGMFLPPVGEQETWNGFGGRTTSLAAMRNYAKGMREKGFHVLSYFNVTEFGTRVKYPAPESRNVSDKELWKDCNDYIYGKLSDAILRVPERVPSGQLGFYPRTKTGGPYFTWEDAIVLDCGEPVYQAFLLDQAKRHIEQIPDATGICIDRMDWLRMYNEQRDDGISWFEGKPVRSLIRSWHDLMEKLGPLMHKAGKVIFVNNHDKRLDLLRHVDGIFDEFTYGGAPLNTTALLCVRKPALGWTSNSNDLGSDPDKFFQKYLYLGVYPMVPFPGNDHSLHPSPEVDKNYLDYGPLMDLMRGKKWVLEPHCVEVMDSQAKVNLFKVPDGYVVPVTFGGRLESATVQVRNLPGLAKLKAEAILPGAEHPQPVKTQFKDGLLELTVPLKRGCAMVQLVLPK